MQLVPDRPVLLGTRFRGTRTVDSRTRHGRASAAGLVEIGFDESRPLDGCYPAGTTDDQGIYLFLPPFVQADGCRHSGGRPEWRAASSCSHSLALVTPADLLLPVRIGSGGATRAGFNRGLPRLDLFTNTDIYWIGAWCYLLAVPLLLLVYKNWGKRSSLIPLAGVVAIGSFATSIRIHSGLPDPARGAHRRPLLRRRSLVQGSSPRRQCCASRISPSPASSLECANTAIAPSAIASLSDRYPTRHPFWHNAYIGLGYQPNRYGIKWNDAVAAKFVRQKDPSRPLISHPNTSEILRNEYFRLASRGSATRVSTTSWRNLDSHSTLPGTGSGSSCCSLPFALFLGPAVATSWRRYLLIAAPTLLVSLPPALLTMAVPPVPIRLGWEPGRRALALARVLGDHSVLPDEIRSRVGARWGTHRRSWCLPARKRGRVTAIARTRTRGRAVTLVVSLFADVLGPRAANPAAEDVLWRTGAGALLQAPARDDALARWGTSRRGSPRSGRPLGGVDVESGQRQSARGLDERR